FPGRQSRTLEKWPCFIHEDMDLFPLILRGKNDGERRTVFRRRQSPRIAMGQHARSIRQQIRSPASDGMTHRSIFIVDGLSFLQQPRESRWGREGTSATRLVMAADPIQGPEEIDG